MKVDRILVLLITFFALIPFSLGHEAIYSGYIAFFFMLLVFKVSMFRLSLYLFFLALIAVSELVNGELELLSSFNPMSIGLPLILKSKYDEGLRINFLRGNIYIGSILPLSIIFFFVYYRYTLLEILVYDREWGERHLYYFGNGLSLVFTASAVITYLGKKYIIAGVHILASLLTTGRTIVFGLLLALVNFTKKYRVAWVVIAVMFVTYIIFEISLDLNTAFLQRSFKSEDRLYNFELAWSYMQESFLLGNGNKDYGRYDHFHNTHLQIVVTNGFLTYIFYLIMLVSFYTEEVKGRQAKYVFAYLLLTSMTQISMHNPNLMGLAVPFILLSNEDHN